MVKTAEVCFDSWSLPVRRTDGVSIQEGVLLGKVHFGGALYASISEPQGRARLSGSEARV